jgi:transposase-like protein
MTDVKKKSSSLGWKDNCIKVCPRCGSTDILTNTLTGFITQPIYVCNGCGYQNTIFPEVDVDTLKNKFAQVKDDLDSEVSDKLEDEKKDL